ncbi:hypothetical protein AC1031_011220 [Aphanomyces cochlioides]|nr:hypothetical protein AC1031_011220 [Aphanomyces cochlioides]
MEEYMKQKMPFYQTAAASIGTKGWKSIKNRCEHLDRKYAKIKQRMSASGFGVRSADPPTLRATITKEFKWYHDLDELLGVSSHVNPLVVLETSQLSNTDTSSVNETTMVYGDNLALDEEQSERSSELDSAEMAVVSQKNPLKRKKPESNSESSISNILYNLGEQGLEIERGRLELMQKKLSLKWQPDVKKCSSVNVSLN